MSSGSGHEVRIGIAIATPIPYVRCPATGQLIKERISVDWHRARMGLGIPTNTVFAEMAVDGLEVGVARNVAVRTTQRQASVPEFLFFIDYDVILPYDALKKLVYQARHNPDYDIFSGVYCTKNNALPEPLIYMKNGQGAYWDWAIGDLIRGVESVGMGCCLIRMSLFDKIEYSDENPWFLSTDEKKIQDGALLTNRGTEDIFFCKRAREEAGAKIMVDTSVLCGHQDFSTGIIYGLPDGCMPRERALWLKEHEVESCILKGESYKCPKCEDNCSEKIAEKTEDEPQFFCLNDECDWFGPYIKPKKIVLDLGAGTNKRTWEGYETQTLDIRADVGANYVQDTRSLNLPDAHFDRVASSHHLEHIGRWDQEKVWNEMYRICKPGGDFEHIVPNVEWAAEMIMQGKMDEHVLNVLYGAQEDHGYERDYNTHYFGYTPDLAKQLAEAAGFIDVTTESWKQNADRGYNLIIRGKRPATLEAECGRSFEEDCAIVDKAIEGAD